MSSNLKASIIPAAATLAIALISSSPIWAQTPAVRTVSEDLHLAMMDMDEMAKMKKGGMGDKKMKGNMPASAPMPMPSADTEDAQDAMPGPPSSDMMGRMRGPMKGKPGMSNMAPASQLPGFPGASHLYHVGSTGFFLDHPQHITLSTQQQTALNRIREKSLLNAANSTRRIDDAEQEVWMLTASEVPDAAQIEAKVRAIESLRADQRMAFIRAVGDAGKVLSADQQTALLGTNPTAATRSTPAAGKAAPTPAAAKPAPMPAMPAPMKME